MTTQDGDMNDEKEPGSDKVTACTRAFEEIDAQVFPGPGRGATQSEAAASERCGGVSPSTVEAYRRMSDLVAEHSRVQRERCASTTASHEAGPTRGWFGDNGNNCDSAAKEREAVGGIDPAVGTAIGLVRRQSPDANEQREHGIPATEAVRQSSRQNRANS